MSPALKSLLLVIVAVFHYSHAAECPSGTTFYNSKCYAKLDGAMSRDNALANCTRHYGENARLAKPLNRDENDFIARNINTITHTWLEFLGNGTHIVGADGKPPSYDNYAPDESQKVQVGQCIAMGHLNGGLWYGYSCGQTWSVLCEFDLVPPTTTTRPTSVCVLKNENFVCPAGWAYYRASCSCYKIIWNTTYYDAMKICRSITKGGRLASVHNFGEAEFIYRLGAQENSNWVRTESFRDNIIVGLTYNSNFEGFIWDDGTDFDFYEGFAPGEPSDYTSQGQIILTNPIKYLADLRMGDCESQTCRYAVCQLNGS